MKNKRILLLSTLLLVSCDSDFGNKVVLFLGAFDYGSCHCIHTEEEIVNIGSYTFMDTSYTLSFKLITKKYDSTTDRFYLSGGYEVELFNPEYLTKNLYNAPLNNPTSNVKEEDVRWSRNRVVCAADKTYASIELASLNYLQNETQSYEITAVACYLEKDTDIDLIATYAAFTFTIDTAILSDYEENKYYCGSSELKLDEKSTNIENYKDFRTFKKVGV